MTVAKKRPVTLASHLKRLGACEDAVAWVDKKSLAVPGPSRRERNAEAIARIEAKMDDLARRIREATPASAPSGEAVRRAMRALRSELELEDWMGLLPGECWDRCSAAIDRFILASSGAPATTEENQL